MLRLLLFLVLVSLVLAAGFWLQRRPEYLARIVPVQNEAPGSPTVQQKAQPGSASTTPADPQAWTALTTEQWKTTYMTELKARVSRAQEQVEDKRTIVELIRGVQSSFGGLAVPREDSAAADATRRMIDTFAKLQTEGGAIKTVDRDYDLGQINKIAFWEAWSAGLLGYGIADYCTTEVCGFLTESFPNTLPTGVCRIGAGPLAGMLSDQQGRLIIPGLKYYSEAHTTPIACRADSLPPRVSTRTDALGRQCEAGDANACVRLGSLLDVGYEGRRDQREALRLFRKGCLAGGDGSYWGCFKYVGSLDDPVERRRFSEWACVTRQKAGCVVFGGDIERSDPVKAVWVYAYACEPTRQPDFSCERLKELCTRDRASAPETAVPCAALLR